MSLINRLDRWFDNMMMLPQDRMAAPEHSPRKKGYIRVKVGRFWKTVRRTHRKAKRIRGTIRLVGRAFTGDQRASAALHKRLFPGIPHHSTAAARRRSLAKTARTAKRPTAAKRPKKLPVMKQVRAVQQARRGDTRTLVKQQPINRGKTLRQPAIRYCSSCGVEIPSGKQCSGCNPRTGAPARGMQMRVTFPNQPTSRRMR